MDVTGLMASDRNEIEFKGKIGKGAFGKVVWFGLVWFIIHFSILL